MDKTKIRYLILKETEKGELFKGVSQENFQDLDLGFKWDQFTKQVEFLVSEGYLTRPFYASDIIYHYSSRVTEKGEQYIEENKWHKKAYRTLKEARDWIKI